MIYEKDVELLLNEIENDGNIANRLYMGNFARQCPHDIEIKEKVDTMMEKDKGREKMPKKHLINLINLI